MAKIVENKKFVPLIAKLKKKKFMHLVEKSFCV